MSNKMENSNKRRLGELLPKENADDEVKGKRMLVAEAMDTKVEAMEKKANIGNVATEELKEEAVEDVATPPQKIRKTEQTSDVSNAAEGSSSVVQVADAIQGNNGAPKENTNILRMEDGRPVLPELGPLQQCQQMQQILGLIQFHEQQVKYRSYIQLDILRHLRKQLSDQMMLHPHRHHYDALVEAAKNNRLTPLSQAEKAALEYFNSMADWTLEARSLLQDKESPFYLLLFGRQVNDFKDRLNEITTHEQFLVFAPIFAERIDYHREMIHTLNRRSSVSLA